ncbi:MAG: alpha-amylase, partial [Acidimicrobiia bacterium]|nr:alpha-amylase [Acidimicrobiia bacterium]
ELLMLRISNENPANLRFRELFDDAPLETHAAYERAINALERFFDEIEPVEDGGGEGVSLIELLRAPAKASPTSLEGQLRFIAATWDVGFLGEQFAALLDRVLRATDVLVEERKEGGLGFGPPPVPDATMLAAGGITPDVEYERFSADSSWMPRVVILAKSTYVWLHQLSRDYQRDISRLDQIPDEELDRLAAAGFSGLWLIGLWERSTASATIKHMRGDPDAVASAYALYDYAIAADLGGEWAYENLRERAWNRGIRLASDMVPNHVGIDGRWVVEQPHWFLSLPEPPYPAYSFTGTDLSPDPRVTIQIEDHYWDGTDAAVVFKRYDHENGDTRYIYHGNDGTAMPWNDTAQLNYLSAEVREGVIQTILHVARKFPIIRFDAAMTLAKRHIRRLWFPAPGEGGAIPSRAQHGLTAAEFEAAIPHEFWREVVDRVAAEVPDTLLLAEAFWMMEGYFVRTLGMHRVYNSAFMHMLAQERNAEYRELVGNVLEFDPEILKRYVNFMNNPDEETAVEQFGKDGKYFGVATVMATMPGLPMFGHGQVEAYTEKYGMEFRTPRRDEYPDQWVVDRHKREIFPLLHRRAQFAEVHNFLMFDVIDGGGGVVENVYAYSNRNDGAASLVLFHNAWGDAHGRIHTSMPYRDKGADEIRTRTLAEGLGLRADPEHDWLIYREHVSGMEYLRRSTDIVTGGFDVALQAYDYRVFLDFREVQGDQYARLADRLGGRGVPSIADELEAMRLEPLRSEIATFVAAAASEDFAGEVPAALDSLTETAERFGVTVDVEAEAFVTKLERVSDEAAVADDLVERLEPPAWRRAFLAAGVIDDDVATQQAFDRAELTAPAPEVSKLSTRKIDPEPEAGKRRAAAKITARRFLESLVDDAQARTALGVNEHEEVEWFDQDRYRSLLSSIATRSLAVASTKKARDRLSKMLTALADAEDASDYRWDYLTEGRPAKAAAPAPTAATPNDEAPVTPSDAVGDPMPDPVDEANGSSDTSSAG